ncbi:MAG: alanine racemase [Pseudomonadota bacterium]
MPPAEAAAPRARIDAAAFAANLQRVRALCPTSKVMAVVKANAYGHGIDAIIPGLKAADGAAVARFGEGVALRKAGWNGRVVVLGGVRDGAELKAAAEHRLDVVAHHAGHVRLLTGTPLPSPVDVWLKFDSGMHRLGFDAQGFTNALDALKACPSVGGPVRLMTHLACADERDNAHTRLQVDDFVALVDGIDGERSIANSAAVLGWPDTHADWVRPGLMLYGVSPFANETAASLGLAPVMTLTSRLIAVKTVPAGGAVGYGATWVAERDTRIGIAAIGYGDGYPWRLAGPASRGAVALVNGERCPLVGRVSMDMTAISLESQPDAQLGDPVVLWGEGLPVEEVAGWAGTLPYELLCGIASRVPR